MKVSSREVAQDITQEAFMRYWQTLRKGDKLQNERAFLYTLARNLVIDWYRKKKESSLDVLSEAGIDFVGDGQKSVTASAEAREILAIMEKLDEDSREVLLLRFVEGFSPKEIALLLNESANTVSVRIHRATKKVQELIHAHE
ncbi:RNA polymerase sigma factor [Patescibacteria group bacterium]|nr:RNA polymerase sigma factor [Patescibacteria group bacterium]